MFVVKTEGNQIIQHFPNARKENIYYYIINGQSSNQMIVFCGPEIYNSTNHISLDVFRKF